MFNQYAIRTDQSTLSFKDRLIKLFLKLLRVDEKNIEKLFWKKIDDLCDI